MLEVVRKNPATVIQICCILFLALFALQFIDYAAGLLEYPYEWDESEGLTLLNAMSLFQGHLPYTDDQQYPLFVAPYPPLYFVISAWVFKLIAPTLPVLRLISLLCALGVGMLLYAFVKEETHSEVLGACSVLLFFANVPLTLSLTSARVDSMALFFALIGVWFFKHSTRRWGYAWFGVLFLLLSCYTKQTFVCIAVAGFIYLFVREKKRVIGLALATLMVGGGVFLLLQRTSAGWFVYHLFQFNMEYGFVWGRVWHYMPDLVICTGVLTLFTLGVIIHNACEKRMPLFHYCVLGAVGQALFIGAEGAGVNHWLGFLAVVSVGFGIGANRILALVDERKHVCVWLMIAAGIVVQIVLFMHTRAILPPAHKPAREMKNVATAVQQYIAEVDGPVLVNAHPSWAFYAGKEVFYFGLSYWANYVNTKTFNAPVLLEDVQKQRFASIILHEHFVPDVLRQAIDKNYVAVQHVPIGNTDGVVPYGIYEVKPK